MQVGAGGGVEDDVQPAVCRHGYAFPAGSAGGVRPSAAAPAKRARDPRASSIRSASFHFAIRSLRAKLPTLSWPTPQPTARWTMVVSSVSPDRAETMPREPRVLRGVPGGEGFRERAALVRLQQHGVGRAGGGGGLHSGGIGDQEIVAHHLDASAEFVREGGEAFGVVLGQRVLDRDDRVGGDPAGEQADHAVGVDHAVLQPEPVVPAAAEIRGGDIERDRDLRAGREAGAFDGADQGFQRVLVGGEIGPPAALVGDAGGAARVLHQPAGGAIDFGGPVQRLGEGAGGGADDQEVLDVDPPAGMRAAAENLDLRQRQGDGVAPAEVAIQRLPGSTRRGMRDRHGDGGHGIGAEAGTGRRAVERDQRRVHRRLVGGVASDQGAGDVGVQPFQRLGDVVAAERSAAIAQVERLARAGGGAGGRHAAPDGAAFQQHVGFERRPAAAVPDPAAVEEGDGGVGHPVPRSGRVAGSGWTEGMARASSVAPSSLAPSSTAQASRTLASRSGGAASRARATRRTRSLSASAVMYSTGDLPSTRARNNPASSGAARASNAAAGSQSMPAR